MTTAFKDFLRQQAEKHQAEVEAAKGTVEEWRAAIDRSRFVSARSDPVRVVGRLSFPRGDRAFVRRAPILWRLADASPQYRNGDATGVEPDRAAP